MFLPPAPTAMMPLLNTRLLRLPHSPPGPPHSSKLPLPCRHHLPSTRRAHPPLRHAATPPPEQGEDDDLDLGGPASAAAVAAAIRRASTASPVRFTCLQREEARGEAEPSADFRRLCGEQLEMFRLVVSRDAALSLYVRPAGGYTMDHQLELRRVALHPDETDVQTVMLVANFSVSAGLRAAESLLVKHQMHVVAELGSVVLPMVRHPFVVGFLVAELPGLAAGHGHATINSSADAAAAAADIQRSSDITPLYAEDKAWVFPGSGGHVDDCSRLVGEWKNSALLISRTLATAYVMDQKAYLLQQNSWQNNVRMSGLVEQIRGPLSNIRALAKMLTAHSKSSEIPYDIVQDILIQGDHLKDTLEQIQDAVYLTKANIVRYNEETLKKIQGSPHSSTGFGSVHGDSSQRVDPMLSLSSDKEDMVMPMPPLWLAPLQHQDARPCDLCHVLKDLVDAASPLAYKQNGTLDVTGVSHPLQVAVEESALRQALSNLIEGALLRTRFGGRVQIYAGEAPAGGTLIVVDDDGPDMQYMTQMHSLAPFGSDLLAEGMLEDNMTWNFIAGLTVAREILENYGCVLRVISPRIPDAVIGTGGSRIEVWLPTFQTELAEITEEA